jgi:hypothetical protein
MPGHEPTHRSHCQNCGAPLSGPYCPQCGQHDVDYNRSILHVVEDALEGFMHFDGKFFRSARYIFTRPGFLTREFIAGRRASYANPVRFYVFASFLFFAFSVLTSHRPAPPEKAAAGADAGKAAPGKDDGPPGAAKPPAGLKVDVSRGLGENQSWLDDPLMIRSDSLDKAGLRELKAETWHLLPEALFVCLPLLALVLKLAYLGSGRLYIEHLIFSLHIQAFAFLSFIVIRVGGLLGSLAGKGAESAAGTLLLLGMYVMIYRAFRAYYGQSRMRTVFKFLLVGAVYGLILLFVLVGIVAASTYLVTRNA